MLTYLVKQRNNSIEFNKKTFFFEGIVSTTYRMKCLLFRGFFAICIFMNTRTLRQIPFYIRAYKLANKGMMSLKIIGRSCRGSGDSSKRETAYKYI